MFAGKEAERSNIYLELNKVEIMLQFNQREKESSPTDTKILFTHSGVSRVNLVLKTLMFPNTSFHMRFLIFGNVLAIDLIMLCLLSKNQNFFLNINNQIAKLKHSQLIKHYLKLKYCEF